jgi:hypothetical protein
MKWQEIRKHYPQQWLLVEAIQAHSEAGKRLIEELTVVNVFPDALTAMREYAHLHRRAPQRELYVLSTEREQIEITERNWLGLRSLPWPQERRMAWAKASWTPTDY